MSKALWRNVKEGSNWYVPPGGYTGTTSRFIPRAHACCRDGNLAIIVGGNGLDSGFIGIAQPGGSGGAESEPVLTFPTTLYVATASGGIFYTSTFTDPTDAAQPVWTAVNGGLGVLTIKNLDIDPFDKVGRQVCLTAVEENCYIRYGLGNWQSLITQAQVRTATQATAKVWWVSFDRGVPGRVWVYALVLSTGVSDMSYFGYSDNDGATWTWQSNADSPTIREGGNFIANGSLIYRGVNDGPGGRSVIERSSNTGASWLRSAQLGISVWNCNVWLSPFGLVYSAGNGVGGPDLVRFDAGLLVTVLQDALNLGGDWQVNDPQTMWHSVNSSGYQRILDTNTESLYTTLDGWATVVDAAPAPLVAGWNFSSLVAPLASNEDWMILGPRLLAVGQQHIIYTLDGDGGVPVGKAGSDPVGGVNSIPLAAAGLAMHGIGVVE